MPLALFGIYAREHDNGLIYWFWQPLEGGGSGQFGSARQRYAELTVYVPKCTSLCIRGAKRGLKLEGVQANVTITDEGGTDSDARGDFDVYGIEGNLICREFPLQSIMS